MHKWVTLFAILVLSLTVVLPVAAVHTPHDASPPIPEKNGDYPDPAHPGVRVRVFVHEPRKSHTTTTAAICTNDDGEAVVSPAGWHLPSGSWTYNLNPSSVPSTVGGSNLFTIADNGFDAWDAAQSQVTFSRGSDTSVTRTAYDGRNIIAWGRTSSSALAVTYIRYYSASGLVVDVDTIFNKRVPWRWTNPAVNQCSIYPDAYEAQAVWTHEGGHWMGLDDEYAGEYVNHSMYGYGQKGDVKANTLTTGDKAGVALIY